MAQINENLIQKIIELGYGSAEQQVEAWEKLATIVFTKDNCITDLIYIDKLLPTFKHFLSSEDPWVQERGAYALAIITETAEYELNNMLIIQARAVPKLVQLLSSSNKGIIQECLVCLLNISYYYPGEVAGCKAIPPLLQLIKANIPKLSHKAACVLKNISHGKENIPNIVEEGSIQILINMIKSKKNELIQEALETLVNIVGYDLVRCQAVLDHGTLELVKIYLNHSSMKSLALEFVEKMLYSENEVDKIIDELVILLVIKQLSSRDGADIKVIAVKIIQIVIEKKPSYVHTLVNNDSISLLAEQLETENIELLFTVLSTLKNVITTIGYYAVRQKLEDCGISEKLQNLREHENDRVKDLSAAIENLFVESIVRDSLVERKPAIKNEQDVAGPSNRRRKSVAHDGRSRSNKRSRHSLAPTETTDNDQKSDIFYGVSSREVSQVFARASGAETNDVTRRSEVPELPNLNLAPTPDQSIDNSSNIIATYYLPSGFFLHESCKKLNLKFDNERYIEFLQRIKFTDIKSTSKPASYFRTNDLTGFSCFSIILCGSDDPQNIEIVQKSINKYFLDKYYSELDAKTMGSIILSSTMKDEHIKFVVELLRLRILIYFAGKWQQYGYFSDDEPIFLIEKKVVEDRTSYKVVLTLND